MAILPGVTSNQGVFATGPGTVALETRPLPESIPAGLLLVKVKAVAINPVDWKWPALQWCQTGAGTGCDFAGEVVGLGDGVEKLGFEKGDSVFAVNSGFQRADFGLLGAAFAEYVFADAVTAFRVPKGATLKVQEDTKETVPAGEPKTFENAASFPLAGLTAALSLGHHFDDQIQFEANGDITTTVADPQSKYILVWGGAGSVGQYAVQIAKAAGFQVITTASPHNAAYLKSLGADHVVDYHDKDASAQIRAIAGNNLVHVLDAISQPDSWQACFDAIADPAANIKQISLLPTDTYGLDSSAKPNVKFEMQLVFIPSFHRFDLTGFNPKDKAGLDDGKKQYVTAAAFAKTANKRFEQGKFTVNPIRLYEKQGVAHVQEAVDYFKTANVSAYKLVVKF